MKLSNKAINALQDRALRLQLALQMGFTEVWMNKLVERNKENGPLTTFKAVQIIEVETGLKQEEILEPEAAEVESTIQK